MVPYSRGPVSGPVLEGELLDPAPGYNPPKGNAAPAPILDGELVQTKANSVPRPTPVPGTPTPKPSPGGIPGRWAGPIAAGIGAGIGLAQGAPIGQVASGLAGGALGGAIGGALGGPVGAAVGAVLGDAIGQATWNLFFPPQHSGPHPDTVRDTYRYENNGEEGLYYNIQVSYQVRNKDNESSYEYTIDIGTGLALNVLAPYAVQVRPNAVDIISALGEVLVMGGQSIIAGYTQTVIGLSVQAQPVNGEYAPVPTPAREFADYSPFTFLNPTGPTGEPQPYREPRGSQGPRSRTNPDPTPTPEPDPTPTPTPVPYPVPVKDTTPDPNPTPTPTPSRGGYPLPGGGGGSGSSTGGSASSVTVGVDVEVKIEVPIQTPAPKGDCDCPPAKEFECKFKPLEYVDMNAKVFDKCELNPNTGKVEAVFKSVPVSVPKNNREYLRLKFERLAEIEAQQCSKDEYCIAAVPDWWSVRVGANVPQLIVQYYDENDSKKRPKYVLTIPHPKSSIDYDNIQIDPYNKGNWMGILTLVDNSKLIVNASSIDEAERVIEEMIQFISPSFLTGDAPKVGKRGGKPLLEITVKPKIVKLFPTGQRDLIPEIVKYLE